MNRINRRRFLSRSGAGAVGAAALWSVSPARVLGANERVNLALIGCGGRGPLVAQGVTEFNARFTHVCDVHAGRAEKAAVLCPPRKVSPLAGFLFSEGGTPGRGGAGGETWRGETALSVPPAACGGRRAARRPLR